LAIITHSMTPDSYQVEKPDIVAKLDPKKVFILLIYNDKLSIILFIHTAKESS